MQIDVQVLNSFKMKRPLFFLCGPALPKEEDYIGRDGQFNQKGFLNARAADRRFIIRESIIQEKDKTSGFYPLPIIVDSIFEKGFIESKDLSLSLMEEIVASISYKTYLFLDTMSTSYELGFFSNHATRDDVSVFLTEESPDRRVCPVGEYILKTIRKKVVYKPECDERGFFGFSNNQTPESLLETLKTDVEYAKKNEETEVRFIQDKSTGLEFGEISYIANDEKLSVSMSLKTFFYFFAYALNWSKGGWNEPYNEKNAVGAFNNALYQSFVGKVKDQRRVFFWSLKRPMIDVSIEGYGFKETAKHCFWLAKKISEIAIDSQKRGVYEQTSALDNSIFDSCGAFSFDFDDFLAVFGSQTRLMKNLKNGYGQNPEKYTKTEILSIRGKRRKIITYAHNRNGAMLREYHQEILKLLEWIYHPSDFVFSYIKKRGALDCLQEHVNNSFFLKLDIHHFFESIRKIACVSEIYHSFFESLPFTDFHYAYQFNRSFKIERSEINDLLSPCFFRGALPIGFVTSPILSNVFMSHFDQEIIEDIDRNFVYTRYADDMLIGSNSSGDLAYAKRCILYSLNYKSYKNLRLNEKKECRARLINKGDSFKFLGILIVFDGVGTTTFRVAKSTLREISKEMAEAIQEKDSAGVERVLGKADYVRHINQDSYASLCRLYRIKTKKAFPKRSS